MDVQKILDAKRQAAAIFTVPLGTTLSEFVRQACEKEIGALLVVDEAGKPVGIVSERDILRQCNEHADFNKVTVDQVMTKNLAMVTPSDDINMVMDLMIARKVRHLPVVSNNNVHGIITIRDVIMAMRKSDKEEISRLVEYLQENLHSDQ